MSEFIELIQAVIIVLIWCFISRIYKNKPAHIINQHIILFLSIVTFITIFNIPYSYFNIARWVIFLGAILMYLMSSDRKEINWKWLFGIIAVLFNPISPIYLTAGQSFFIKVISFIIFLTYYRKEVFADELLKELGEAGSMTRTEISNHFGSNKGAKEISRALTLLTEQGLIHSKREVSESGRPAERFFKT